jgi:hypothetical protein
MSEAAAAGRSPHSSPVPDFSPRACLRLPDREGEVTEHAAARMLGGEHDGQLVYVLTEGGRAVFCAHLASSHPWTTWPEDFIEAIRPYNNIAPPMSLSSWEFHMVNLLWRFQDFAFRRSDLTHVKDALFECFQNSPHPDWFPRRSEDTDVIQHVNKSGQWGLAHNASLLLRPQGGSTTYYWLRRPVKYDQKCREPRPADFGFQPILPSCACPTTAASVSSSDMAGLAAERARVIDYLYRTWVGVPLKEWTLDGHRDPDNKELGVVAQPSEYNRHSKSKWKFDEYGMKECPTVDYLRSRLEQFYPSLPERKALLIALFQSLSPKEREAALDDLLGDLG